MLTELKCREENEEKTRGRAALHLSTFCRLDNFSQMILQHHIPRTGQDDNFILAGLGTCVHYHSTSHLSNPLLLATSIYNR